MADAMQGVLGSEQARMSDLTQKQAALEEKGPQIEQAREKRDLGIEQDYERSADSMKPPKFEPVPSPTVKSTDPKEVWGSSAMWLAGLASLMTRTPLMTAMNAAAGVLKGYHDGDVQAANQAFQTWKVASENAMKAFEFEQDTYKEAMGRLEKRTEFRERQSATEATAQERERVAQLNAVGRSLQDTFMANVKSTEAAEKMMEERQRHADSMAENGLKLAEQHYVMSAMDEWQKKHPDADAIEKATQLSKFMYTLSPSAAKDQAKVDAKLDEVYNDPAKKQVLIGKYDASVPGKASANADTAGGIIRDLAKDPDIKNNPAKQLGLVDKLIFMETGSIRPALAQYQKILGAQTGRDMFDMAEGRIAHHPILGTDQIKNIASAAEDLHKSANKTYADYLAQPERGAVARRLGMLDDEGNLARPNPGGEPEVATPTTKADYDALPKGAHYTKPGDPPSTVRVKQ